MNSVRIDASEVRVLAADIRSNAARTPARASRAVSVSGHRLQGRAQTKAPVDTGLLKSSIKLDLDELTAEVGSDLEYAIYQELGTSEMSAQPYLAPAFDEELPEFEKAIANIGEEILK